MSGPLEGKTLFISGGSRGIGLAIAVRAARDGANVCLIAKTAEPDPRLPGTIHTAAAEIEAAGGHALPVVGDIRDEDSVLGAVQACVERFGGIEICVNNASAINLSGTLKLPMKRYDLMQDINTRGTFLVSKTCVPWLKQAQNPHVLMLSPPLDMQPKWFGSHPAYTISKFGMSMLTMGMAEEFRPEGVAFNALWPRTLIATAAVQNVVGGDVAMRGSRRPEIMADAAHAIVTRPARETTGNFFIDDEVLRAEGVSDFGQYRFSAHGSEADLIPDLYVESERAAGSSADRGRSSARPV
jgi:citronellol/citronellal dehydrogenase